MTHYLVTGPTGFLGYHVIKLLNSRGIRPRVLLPTTVATTSPDFKSLQTQDVEVVPGDVDDPIILLEACKDIDTVLHLRFTIALGGGPRVEQSLFQGNVVGTRNVLDAAERAGVARVVVSSSSLAVGLNRKPLPIDEEADWTLHAFTLPYALSRRQAEQEALSRSSAAHPAVVAVNPSFTLGPEDYVGAPANGLVMKMSKPGFRITAPIGFGILDVRDYADGVIRAAERGTPGRRYILSGPNITPDQLAREVAGVAGIAPPGWMFPLRAWMLYPIVHLLQIWSQLTGKPIKVSPRLLELWGRYAWYDTSRARAELGWQPESLRKTLEDTVRWMRESRPS